MPNPISRPAATLAASLTLFASAHAQTSSPVRPLNRRPNIVLIMCDDLGWADLNVPRRRTPSGMDETETYWQETYGSVIGEPDYAADPPDVPNTVWAGTENLKMFAQDGMVFNRFYAPSPVCTPTRASFLTGRYHERMEIDRILDPLLNRELTMAEVAKALGYSTAHIGKWHLGRLNPPNTTADGSIRGYRDLPNHQQGIVFSDGENGPYSAPWHHGFDRVLSFSASVQSFNPYGRREDVNSPDERPISLFWSGDGVFQADDGTYNDEWTSQILVDDAKEFIKTETSDPNDGRPYFMTLWLHAGHKIWNSQKNPMTSSTAAVRDEDYARVLRRLDEDFAGLMKEVTDSGEETLVVLTSDNGPDHFQGDLGPLPGAMMPETLRGRKRQVLEGGVRVPGIFWWPEVICPGSNDEVSSIIDLFPTLLDIWGFPMDDPSGPIPGAPKQDGESLLPIFNGTWTGRQRGLYFQYQRALQSSSVFPVQQAYIDPNGRWKIARRAQFDDASDCEPFPPLTNDLRADVGPYPENWVLYDLTGPAPEGNPRECKDRSAADPTQRTTMILEWEAIRDDVLSIESNEGRTASDYEYLYTVASVTQKRESFAVDDYPEGIDLDNVAGVCPDVTSPPSFLEGDEEALDCPVLDASCCTTPTPLFVVERQFATIEADLTVNLAGSDYAGVPLAFTNNGSMPAGTGAVVPAGSVVFSYLIHFDPGLGFDPVTGIAQATATLDFDHEILGIAWADDRLVASDGLAFGQPAFPGAERAALDSLGDSISLSSPTTIGITMNALDHAADPIDQIRVITASGFVEPPQPCVADFDRNGTVEPADQTAFVDAFLAGDLIADLASPACVLDLDDIDVFNLAYTAGCP